MGLLKALSNRYRNDTINILDAVFSGVIHSFNDSSQDETIQLVLQNGYGPEVPGVLMCVYEIIQGVQKRCIGTAKKIFTKG